MSPFHATPLHFIFKRMPEATFISVGWSLSEQIKPRILIKSSHLSSAGFSKPYNGPPVLSLSEMEYSWI